MSINIEDIKGLISSHDFEKDKITIVGSKDSVGELKEFVENAKFVILEQDSGFPLENTVFVIPNLKDKPILIRHSMSDIERQVIKLMAGL